MGLERRRHSQRLRVHEQHGQSRRRSYDLGNCDARAVALPAAMAARRILEGRNHATGVQMPPPLPELHRPVLSEPAEHGFDFQFRNRYCPELPGITL